MARGRLEAFTDAVIAILITVMVLDLHAPHGHVFGNLRPLVPDLLVYLLSFAILAIYWNNHHHLMHLVERIDGRVLWSNMLWLFCLSLTPVATSWLGPNTDDKAPTLVYGVVLLAAAVSYFALTRALLAVHPPDSPLARAIGRDWKGKLSVVAYVLAIGLTFVEPWLGIAIYIAVALAWFIPDSRVEHLRAGEAGD